MQKRKRINEYTLRDEIFIAVATIVMVVLVTSLISHLLGGRPEEYESLLVIIQTMLTR